MTIERIQGTDGIRGPICLADDSSTSSPLDALINESVLTEDFFELYTYSYCLELLHSGFAKMGDDVVIGWDPRDASGVFNEAAVGGIRKAGLTAVVVGILPTPAISLYQLHVGAVCCFVLTASHNPADQNGIKIFLGSSNLKLFPEDDKRLTRRCFQHNDENLISIPLEGNRRNQHQEARELFINFMKDPTNHWISDIDLSQFTLFVDGANGAFSEILQEALESFQFGQLNLTNCNPQNGINSHSGVADIEGVSCISAEQIIAGEFSHYETLNKLLKEGRQQKNQLMESHVLVMAFVFDGDGDRCFILSYDPFEDEVIVLNGDMLAHIQAWLLDRRTDWMSIPLFVNTVESDLQAGQVLSGFETMQCAVGDKWILWQSYLTNWQTQSDYFQKQILSLELTKLLCETEELIEKMNENCQFDALALTQKFKNIDDWVLENAGQEVFDQAKSFACKQENNRFAIGSEVSGHVISLGQLERGSTQLPVFIGNGLKTALNSLSAMSEWFEKETPYDFYQWLRNPFPAGYEKSLPVYYVDKSILNDGSDFRDELEKLLLSKLQWQGMESIVEKRPEEPEMIFVRVKQNGYSVATVFVRNSGTEDKMSLYLRGIREVADQLHEIENDIYCYLFLHVKNSNNSMAQAEQQVLSLLNETDKTSEDLKIVANENVLLERLLHEMNSREKLIQQKAEIWSITELGKACLGV